MSKKYDDIPAFIRNAKNKPKPSRDSNSDSESKSDSDFEDLDINTEYTADDITIPGIENLKVGEAFSNPKVFFNEGRFEQIKKSKVNKNLIDVGKQYKIVEWAKSIGVDIGVLQKNIQNAYPYISYDDINNFLSWAYGQQLSNDQLKAAINLWVRGINPARPVIGAVQVRRNSSDSLEDISYDSRDETKEEPLSPSSQRKSIELPDLRYYAIRSPYEAFGSPMSPSLGRVSKLDKLKRFFSPRKSSSRWKSPF